ncbi:MAG: DinB family protein [Chloroflexi bacterium]|nr:DinB family protein [Chloroflexota bacterium]
MEDRELLKQWDDVLKNLYAALDLLRDDQLAFTAHEGLWSLGQTACHIAGTEEDFLRHRCYGRWGGEECDYQLKDYPSVSALKNLLADVHARTTADFSAVEDLAARLEQPAVMPWGPTVTWRWAVWHVLEHTIHHRGEIFLMLGLQGMEAPDV